MLWTAHLSGPPSRSALRLLRPTRAGLLLSPEPSAVMEHAGLRQARVPGGSGRPKLHRRLAPCPLGARLCVWQLCLETPVCRSAGSGAPGYPARGVVPAPPEGGGPSAACYAREGQAGKGGGGS